MEHNYIVQHTRYHNQTFVEGKKEGGGSHV